MIRTVLLSLCLILTSSVMAQASFTQIDLGLSKISSDSWIATHATQIQLDGMNVIAALESVDQPLVIPDFVANNVQTLMPLHSSTKKYFRVVFTSAENSALRASFPLVGRNVSIDGQVRYAYLSQREGEFQFLIVAQEDGSLRASFTRQLGPEEITKGEFTLAPLPSILQK